ncbi:MAG: efflux RND transporter permease subunit [Candidatus Tritonobacter lacicola]|nr:efflux RND transporter permease subunit [Candidatus Tritonobacter lacicola]
MPPDNQHSPPAPRPSPLDTLIRFCLENKLVVALLVLFLVVAGIITAPFDWDLSRIPVLRSLERSPVPTDAIPDIGENQQIVFTEWMGRSPQDVEDQVTYPLTVSLLGIPGVKTIRSYSFFGFSTIYIIFDEKKLFSQENEFYWTRSRILEKLNSLLPGTLPEGVQPILGPDATPLGQIFWYTLEGRDKEGKPTGGWDLNELRSIQDWYVRYTLLSAGGVSEVASIGGFVQEYQIDVDPDAMRAFDVTLEEVFNAVRMSNVDVGARSIEVNKVEYFIRGLGFIKGVRDIELSVIKMNENVPIYVKDIGTVALGPALRRGALDKEGAEAVGGIVVVRYGENPLKVIKNVKEKIEQIAHGLPRKTLPDGTVSQVTIVPYYDRTGLIYETLGTLNKALTEEVLITIIVVLVMMMHLRSSILISFSLPLAILFCFVIMKLSGVDANIVSLSGIAIAIGTIVDMGIIVCENILKHLDEEQAKLPTRHSTLDTRHSLEVIFKATSEVGSAVLTAIATTVVSFIPVFTMMGAEGKLFRPLAFTKTFALIASVIIALTIIPPGAHLLFRGRFKSKRLMQFLNLLLILAGIVVAVKVAWWGGLILILMGCTKFVRPRVPEKVRKTMPLIPIILAILVVAILLTKHWLPLGPGQGFSRNFIFVVLLSGSLLAFFKLFERFFGPILRWCLNHKLLFLSLPILIVVAGGLVWSTLGKEFMPPLDEGSFLWMPTTMPHASIGEALDVLQKQDMLINSIPEVESVVGKLGRAETPLDPAPISMIETVIHYKPEYITDKEGHRQRFKYDRRKGEFVRDENGNLIPDSRGRPYRQWRPNIKTPDDIWKEIARVAEIPGTTSAPKLQPIAARIVMLQSGMRAPMGVKVKGPDLDTIDKVGLRIERYLKEVPSVEPASVIADRIVGKPYLEIEIDREAIARYGIHIRRIQDVIEVAVGGKKITTTVEGRERYPVRVRYLRELRDQIETLDRILVPAADGSQIPLEQLARIVYVRGPQVVKTEDTFLVGYVIFDMKPGHAEVDVVEDCKAYLEKKMESGDFELPAGVSFDFAGSYENQLRAQAKLKVILPLALFIIFLILYFQFKSVPTTVLVFSSIFVAWAGGFIMIGLYGQPWFLNFSVFGVSMRALFQVHPFNLSVAVWVGFLALFGIASDNGVVMATYLDQSFKKRRPGSIAAIREATIEAGLRRVRPCLMTAGTTILALIPILTSTGRGADVMVPMAIPSFGGMTIVLITLIVVPVLYAVVREFKHRTGLNDALVTAIVVLTFFVAPVLYCAGADLMLKFRPKAARQEKE